MAKQLFRYTLFAMFTYLGLVAAEIFILKPLIDFFGNGFKENFIVYSILILIIDPLLLRLISNRIVWKSMDEEGDDM